MKQGAVVTILATVLMVPDAGLAAESGHGSCAECHGEGNILKVTPVTALCLGCHPTRRSDHRLVALPTGMITTLPLDKGTMTCLTCHDPHGTTAVKKLLRKPAETLCLECHEK